MEEEGVGHGRISRINLAAATEAQIEFWGDEREEKKLIRLYKKAVREREREREVKHLIRCLLIRVGENIPRLPPLRHVTHAYTWEVASFFLETGSLDADVFKTDW